MLPYKIGREGAVVGAAVGVGGGALASLSAYEYLRRQFLGPTAQGTQTSSLPPALEEAALGPGSMGGGVSMKDAMRGRRIAAAERMGYGSTMDDMLFMDQMGFYTNPELMAVEKAMPAPAEFLASMGFE